MAAVALVAAAPAVVPKRLSVTSQTPVTAKGSLKGDQFVDYVLAGTEGHTLSVAMTTTNRSAYFNLTAPGSDTALFIGSIDGGKFSGKLPVTGDYRLRVYLMRSAARRGDSADYRLRAWVLPTR
ncbi:hypothetical protein ACFOMD_11675 [Sphingoaurantiacus capsulatus]|uniref:DNA breaking-rejoining protein n=1 Tax=Sphingoaurantiacus capsulatus TaxID=1771310 RepID=A0ABV7XDA9_9SPHN